MATARPYAGEADYARMRALLGEICALSGPPTYCSIGDLDWWRFTANENDMVTFSRLWFDDQGELIGIGWPTRNQVDMMTHPRHRAIEGEILAWAEQRLHDLTPAGGDPARLRAWGYTTDEARVELLQRRGYTRTDDFMTHFAQSLDHPPPDPRLPPGYALRSMQDVADLEQRVAVHRDAFDPSRMTVEKHRAVMAAPTYRPDLDLVVVAPDGSFAAFCIVWFDAANQLGVFEPVGCHSAHRRKGLAQALLNEGRRRVRALGARTAEVCSWRDDSQGALLYPSAGFRALDRNYAWEQGTR